MSQVILGNNILFFSPLSPQNVVTTPLIHLIPKGEERSIDKWHLLRFKMFQYRAGIIWGGRESAARFSFQGICCSRFLLPRILQLYGILQLRFQGWIAKKGRMSYPIYIYIYSSNVPAYNRLFSFKMIHRPDSWSINWKYFWNIAFQILQVTVIVSIYFFFPTFCFPRNFKREREKKTSTERFTSDLSTTFTRGWKLKI